MGKEEITIEVDAALMARLRAEGVDPQTYVARLANRRLANPAESAERLRQWRRDNKVDRLLYGRDRGAGRVQRWRPGLVSEALRYCRLHADVSRSD